MLCFDDLLGGSVDPPVHGEHDHQGYVKCPERGVQLVGQMLADEAGWHVGSAVLVAEYQKRRHADEPGEQPDGADAGPGPSRRAPDAVGQGSRDGQVAVDGDHAQVEDGGGARGNVHGHPGVAGRRTEVPAVAGELEMEGGRHDQQGHAEVGDGQGHEEVVGRVSQPADETYGEANERVAHCRGAYERSEAQGER